ncbi:sensor histidine kinase [Puia dinghuensis]|uniref:histidine kinase n=1 Tax=Puia dinghuensis TaxID=1792502 RepID=A0A8J2UAZ9_9BACT|nr:histidine kinase dimerization/phosphoacceptor domain -containing protein [Puia dinghuensis]GGA91653.1 hypothetical protein GCM10011511_13770 [Puia dinghuensis]
MHHPYRLLLPFLLFACLTGSAVFASPGGDTTQPGIPDTSKLPPDSIGMHLLRACRDLREQGDYMASLEKGLQALQIFRQTGNRIKEASTDRNLAQLYQFMGEQNSNPDYIRQGLNYARTSLDLCVAAADTAGMVASNNTWGVIYRSMALINLDQPYWYDSAMACYNKALATISPSGKGKGVTAPLYNNISQVYSEGKKDYPAALHYLDMAVRIAMAEHSLDDLSHDYGNISAVYQKMGDKKKSLEYAYKTLDMARQIGTANRLINAYCQLYNSYDHFGKADSAFKYYFIFDNMRDSMASLAATKQISDAQTKYETEKKQALIADLNGRNSRQQKRIALLLTGLAVVVLFFVGLFVLFKRGQRQKRLISTQAGQLEVMMKELHHRVKNNLQIISSLLSLQSYRLKDDEALEAIRLSQQRVQAMSFIHQRLYSTDQARMVNMQEYLQDLTRSLVMAYGYTEQTLDLQVEIARQWLDIDKALPLGLIANEITTNALKYAFKDGQRPALYIGLAEDGEHLLFTVKDNGRGWDMKRWEQPGASFGRTLVETLCRQLKATQNLTYHNGSIFAFAIPKDNTYAG